MLMKPENVPASYMPGRSFVDVPEPCMDRVRSQVAE